MAPRSTRPLHRRVCSAALLFAAACGDSGGSSGTVDAAVDSGGNPNLPTAELVACPASGAMEFRPTPTMYVPMSISVARGKIINFAMFAEHTATSEDRLFTIRVTSDNKCVRFNKPGTYSFYCEAHGYKGSVVVQ
jgi:plastocyanin